MKVKKLAACLLAAGMLFSGCHKEQKTQAPPTPEKSPEPVEEVDPNWPAKAGGVVQNEKPAVVVSLSPALTEIVYELGGSLEAVSSYCDYPQEVSGLESCGTPDAPDLQVLEKLEPDLLLSSAPLAEGDLDKLEELGVTVAVFPRAKALEDIQETYVSIAALLDGAVDGAENGKAVFDRLLERYDRLAAAAQGGQLSGIWLRSIPLVMATGDTFEGKLLEEALGIKNDAGEYTGWQYPPDKAVDLYPDVIFYDASIDPAYFAQTTVYNTTDAYKQNRMYAFDSLPFERQSGRMLDQLEQMAQNLAGGGGTE